MNYLEVRRETAVPFFAEKMRERASLYGRQRPIDAMAYAREHHLDVLRRSPLRFDDRPYLRGIYAETAQRRVIRKSVQCGITEWAQVHWKIRAGEQGYSVLYVLQSQTVRSTFVPNRVDRLDAIVPHYRNMRRTALGSAESVALKHFGLGMVKFVGSNSVDEFTEFPADVLIVDEYDRCDQANLLLAPDRLTDSKLREDFRFSTPTIQGFGIDRLYAQSDARRWMLHCPACKLVQPLDWFANVVREVERGVYELRDREWTPEASRDVALVCASCEKPLDRTGPGEWVAEHLGREVAGFHVSKLFTPSAKEGEQQIASLWKKFCKARGNAGAMQVFMNSELGLAYTAEGAALTRPMLDRAVDPDLVLKTAGEGCTMGADVGATFHVRISERTGDGKRRAVFIGQVANDAELDRLMRVYRVRVCVVDFAPETHLMRQFQARHARKVWLCRYGTPGAEPKFDADTRTVTWCRTRSLDASHEDIDQGRNVLPKNWAALDGGNYGPQMMALTRVLDEKAGRYVWDEGGKADHHRHADNYDWIANDLIARAMVGGGWGARVIG